MPGKTLADNHLSSLASKGRYGDTEMVQTSKGEMWHVNPAEKALMGMMGKEGEKLVDAVGSGTTNPETGLEEQFVDPMTAFAIGQFAVQGFSYLSGQSAEKDQSKVEQQYLKDELSALDNQEQVAQQGYSAKVGANMAEYGMGVEDLSAQTGIAKEDLNEQTNKAIEKSGLVTSGGIQQKQSVMWDRISGAFGRGKKGLLASLGSKMGEVEGWFESQKAGIAANRASITKQMDFAKMRERSGLFG
tara:strand:+ start:285 stop:1019 length:735 start_codon:yes stop_codon:yes gene_type:complete